MEEAVGITSPAKELKTDNANGALVSGEAENVQSESVPVKMSKKKLKRLRKKQRLMQTAKRLKTDNESVSVVTLSKNEKQRRRLLQREEAVGITYDDTYAQRLKDKAVVLFSGLAENVKETSGESGSAVPTISRKQLKKIDVKRMSRLMLKLRMMELQKLEEAQGIDVKKNKKKEEKKAKKIKQEPEKIKMEKEKIKIEPEKITQSEEEKIKKSEQKKLRKKQMQVEEFKEWKKQDLERQSHSSTDVSQMVLCMKQLCDHKHDEMKQVADIAPSRKRLKTSSPKRLKTDNVNTDVVSGAVENVQETLSVGDIKHRINGLERKVKILMMQQYGPNMRTKELNRNWKVELLQRQIKEFEELKMQKCTTMAKSSCKVKVAIDLSFDDVMSEIEINECFQQIARCHNLNERCVNPVQFYITGSGGKLLDKIEEAIQRKKWDAHFNKDSFDKVFPTESIVYLARESENVIDTLEDDKVYIIGGLYDHKKVRKGRCFQLVKEKGVSHARFPIIENINWKTPLTLEINQVFRVLVDLTQGVTWKDALVKVLPAEKKEAETEKENVVQKEDEAEKENVLDEATK